MPNLMVSGDGLRFCAAVIILIAAFAGGMFLLRRERRPAWRAVRFIALVVVWFYLAVVVMNVLHLFMGEVAAAWIVALLLWTLAMVGRGWYGRRGARPL
jgi:hypothetical protein